EGAEDQQKKALVGPDRSGGDADRLADDENRAGQRQGGEGELRGQGAKAGDQAEIDAQPDEHAENPCRRQPCRRPEGGEPFEDGGREAIAPMRKSSPSLNGETALSANPMAVTAVASPSVAAGAEAVRMTCQRQPRITRKARYPARPMAIHPGLAPLIAATTSSGWTVRSSP